jgi:hypothetical protein
MNGSKSHQDAKYMSSLSLSENNLYSQQSANSTSRLNEPYSQPSMPPAQPTANVPHHSIMNETEEELTEDERIEYEKGIISWAKIRNWRFWIRREWLWWYILAVILVILVALMAFFHQSVSPRQKDTFGIR